MAERDDALVKEIWGLFKTVQAASFATVEEESPRVRPVALVHHDSKLWIATGTQSNKVKQLMLNPNMEFHFPVGEEKTPGYVRGAGTVEIVEDKETRAKLAAAMPFFSRFWKSADDPNFALLRLHVTELEYMKPGEWMPRRCHA